MDYTVEFERCINFMVLMLEKYGDELLKELEEDELTTPEVSQ